VKKRNKNTKWLKSISTKQFELEVYQCKNGFHIGLDSSYLDQVSDIDVEKLCKHIQNKKYDKEEG